MPPESIINHAATGILEVRWQDGTRQQLGNAFLRKHCQCADCKVLRLNGEQQTPPGETRVTDIVPVGMYAVQLTFNDGHARGIFPWQYLRSLVNE